MLGPQISYIFINNKIKMSSPKRSERLRLKRLLGNIEGTPSEYPSENLDSVGVGSTTSMGCTLFEKKGTIS